MLSRLMTRREQFVLAFFGLAIVVGSLVIYQRDTDDEIIPVIEEAALAVPFTPDTLLASAVIPEVPDKTTATLPPVMVSVQGAVFRPGLYTFHAHDRVQDAIARAGGLADSANTESLNLAAMLVDATTLTIPVKKVNDPNNRRLLRQETTSPISNPAAYSLTGRVNSLNASISPSSSASPDGRININTATQSQLESLPGIGPAYASAIISYRQQQPFRSVEELMQIRGIGVKRFASIKGLIAVD